MVVQSSSIQSYTQLHYSKFHFPHDMHKATCSEMLCTIDLTRLVIQSAYRLMEKSLEKTIKEQLCWLNCMQIFINVLWLFVVEKELESCTQNIDRPMNDLKKMTGDQKTWARAWHLRQRMSRWEPAVPAAASRRADAPPVRKSVRKKRILKVGDVQKNDAEAEKRNTFLR